MKKSTLEFYANCAEEKLFSARGVKFKEATIHFREIDIPLSRKNSARSDAIIPETVQEYKHSIMRGDVFPRMAVYKTSRGYVLISGNQRSQAILELIADGELEADILVEVCVVQCGDPIVLDELTWACNDVNGLRPTIAERTSHAADAVMQRGISTADAAQRYLLSKDSVQSAVRARETRDALIERGVPGASGMPVTMLDRLHVLSFDHDLMADTAKIASENKWNSTVVSELVTHLRAAKTRPQRAKILIDAQQNFGNHDGSRRQSTVRIVSDKPIRDKILRKLSDMLRLLETSRKGEPLRTSEEAQFTTPDDRKKLAELWGNVSRAFQRIQRAKK